MNVDHTLASFSDYAFFSAFIIYSLALVLSVVFYIKRQGLSGSGRNMRMLHLMSISWCRWVRILPRLPLIPRPHPHLMRRMMPRRLLVL